MMRREPAWRVFAQELNQSTLTVKDEGVDKSPNYLISPLGAKMNRLLLVGVATEINNYGDENDPFWKIRVVDVNGVFFVSAGQYNASVLKKIPKLKVPSFVAVVGKTRTYTPEGVDTTYISVTPELIKEVETDQRKIWVLETAKHLKKRIENYEYIKQELEEPTRESIMALGFSEQEADGFARAMEHYPEVDLNYYKGLAKNALRSLLPHQTEYMGDSPEDDEMSYEMEAFQRKESAVEETAAADTGEVDLSAGICDLVKAAPSEEGILWVELMEQAQTTLGISQEKLEEVVNNLLDDGILFEPVLGKLNLV